MSRTEFRDQWAVIAIGGGNACFLSISDGLANFALGNFSPSEVFSGTFPSQPASGLYIWRGAYWLDGESEEPDEGFDGEFTMFAENFHLHDDNGESLFFDIIRSNRLFPHANVVKK